MSGFCIKGLTAVRKKSQKDQLGSFDLRPTSLNCLLQESFRDNPLDHIWRAQKAPKYAKYGQLSTNLVK